MSWRLHIHIPHLFRSQNYMYFKSQTRLRHLSVRYGWQIDKSPVSLIQENHNGLTTAQLWWLGDEEPGISCFHSLHPHHSLSILHCCSQFFCHPKICKILENDDETYYTNFLVLVNSSKKTSFLTWFRKQKTLLKNLGARSTLSVPSRLPQAVSTWWVFHLWRAIVILINFYVIRVNLGRILSCFDWWK